MLSFKSAPYLPITVRASRRVLLLWSLSAPPARAPPPRPAQAAKRAAACTEPGRAAGMQVFTMALPFYYWLTYHYVMPGIHVANYLKVLGCARPSSCARTASDARAPGTP